MGSELVEAGHLGQSKIIDQSSRVMRLRIDVPGLRSQSLDSVGPVAQGIDMREPSVVVRISVLLLWNCCNHSDACGVARSAGPRAALVDRARAVADPAEASSTRTTRGWLKMGCKALRTLVFAHVCIGATADQAEHVKHDNDCVGTNSLQRCATASRHHLWQSVYTRRE